MIILILLDYNIIYNIIIFKKGINIFQCFTSLSKLVLVNGLTILGHHMFYMLGSPKSLMSVIIPSTLKNIGNVIIYTINYIFFFIIFFFFNFWFSCFITNNDISLFYIVNRFFLALL